MTIDEAIEHAEWCAENSCGECADDHRQLAEWLKELRKRQDVDGALQDERNLFVQRLGDYSEYLRDARAENAKLRELMRDTYDCICEMYRYVDGGYAYEDAEADPAYGPILKRMRDFGIEVPHGHE
jgi:hypothetical protein